MNRKGKNLTYCEIFAYGTGGVFINLAGACDQFGMYFLTNVAMLPAAVVGTMMMFSTIFDAVNDPIIGSLADQNQSRIGKYRPFLIAGGLLTGIVSILRFTVPDFSVTGKIVYYAVLLCLFSIGFTACSVPWQAMMSLLTPDYHERNILLSTKSISGNLVGMIVNAVILSCVAALGGAEGGGWWKFAVIAWLIALPFIFICQSGMKRVDYQGAIPSPPKEPFFRRLCHLLCYKPVLCLCLAVMISSTVISMTNVCEMYYYEYVLHDVGVLRDISIWGFPITLGCAFLLPVILKWIDKRHLILLSFGISMIKPVSIFIGGAGLSSEFVVVLMILSRVGTAFLSAAIFAWIPECVDYTNYRDGAASAGMITAGTTFMMKLGRALGQTLAGNLMSAAGFSAAAEITDRIIGQILNINGLYPIIGLCLTIVPILFFPISRERAEQIRAELEERDGVKREL